MLRLYFQNAGPGSKKWQIAVGKLNVLAGIFPPETESVKEYCRALLEALKDIDVLGVWFNIGEAALAHEYCKNAKIGNFMGVGALLLQRPMEPLSRRQERACHSPL